jgi:hypothetical protein
VWPIGPYVGILEASLWCRQKPDGIAIADRVEQGWDEEESKA